MNRFTSLRIFVNKKVENQKNKDPFYYISFKSSTQGGLSFFQIPTFLLTKVLREGNLLAKRFLSSANSALGL